MNDPQQPELPLPQTPEVFLNYMEAAAREGATLIIRWHYVFFIPAIETTRDKPMRPHG